MLCLGLGLFGPCTTPTHHLPITLGCCFVSFLAPCFESWMSLYPRLGTSPQIPRLKKAASFLIGSGWFRNAERTIWKDEHIWPIHFSYFHSWLIYEQQLPQGGGEKFQKSQSWVHSVSLLMRSLTQPELGDLVLQGYIYRGLSSVFLTKNHLGHFIFLSKFLKVLKEVGVFINSVMEMLPSIF